MGAKVSAAFIGFVKDGDAASAEGLLVEYKDKMVNAEDPGDKAGHHRTALGWAVHSGHLEVVKMLVCFLLSLRSKATFFSPSLHSCSAQARRQCEQVQQQARAAPIGSRVPARSLSDRGRAD
jgi:hypothetical protein